MVIFGVLKVDIEYAKEVVPQRRVKQRHYGTSTT